MNCSPPGSSVHGSFQTRILEWVAMPSSRGSSWHRDWTCVSYVSCTGRQVLYHYTVLSYCCVQLCDLMYYSPPGSSVYGYSLGKDTGLSCHALLQGINPGIEPSSSTLQEDSLLTDPPGKPKNTGTGSLCLLQGIFLTQESNWGLLHCRCFFTSGATFTTSPTY